MIGSFSRRRPFLPLPLVLFGIVFPGPLASADSMAVTESWKDNTVGGIYSGSSDTGAFTATLTVPGLSTLSSSSWSNLQVTLNSSSLDTGAFSDTMADAPYYGGTVSAVGATFYFQLGDTNGNLVNAYKLNFSRSGNSFSIAGSTLNPASLEFPPWSILAGNYLDYSGRATFIINDQTTCEVLLQDTATTYAIYADVVKTLFIHGTNSITADSQATELNEVHVTGAADFSPPTLQAVSPPGAVTTTNALLTVQVRAADNLGVTNVEFYLNGLDYGPGVAGASNLWSLNFALPPGSSTVQTLATDGSGNNSATNSLTVTYVNPQTNASSILVAEHWQDSSQTNGAGAVFLLSQDVGVVSAALPVPGLQGLSPVVWSNLVLTVAFGNIAFSNRLAAAAVVTTNQAVFYLNTTVDPNHNPLVDEQLTVARAGNTLRLSVATGNPTYDGNHPILANAYLGGGGSIREAIPFTLTLQDGATFNSYATISKTIHLSGGDTVTRDAQTNQLNNLLISGAADYTPPTVSITAPTGGQRWSNALFSVAGTAGDNLAVSNVLYSLNNGDWTNALSSNQWTNWTAPATLTPGTNLLKAYAVDAAGNNSSTSAVTFVYVLSGQLQLGALGLGSFSPNYSNAWLQIGQVYSVTSAPARGFKFSNWTVSTNWLGGVTNASPVLRFTMASNLTLLAAFTDTNRPTLAISAPAAGQRMTNALATFIGTAGDNWQVAAVWCQLNGHAWSLVATGNGYTNWTQPMALVAGTNTFKAFAQDVAGNFSLTNTLSVFSSNTFQLQLFLTNAPVPAGGLTLSLQISPGLSGHLQYSSDLLAWAPLTNFIGARTNLAILDTSATNADRRFYRAVVP